MLSSSELELDEKILCISKWSEIASSFHEAIPEIPPENMILFTTTRMPEEEMERLKPFYREIVRFAQPDFSSTKFEIACIKAREGFPYSRIVVFSEDDLVLASHLRKLFGLSGQTLESALAFTNKYHMKKRVSEFGIELPDYSKVKSACEIFEFLETHDFPVVIKPIAGAGSVNTHLITSHEELELVLSKFDYFNHYHPQTFLVESYVEGEMYHVDGIVHNGEHLIIYPSKYINTCLDFVNGEPLGTYILTEQNVLFEPLQVFTKKCLSALPAPKNYVFHLELFLTEDKRMVFCEVASRVGGGEINLTWKESLGIDLRKEFFRIQAGLSPSIGIRSAVQTCTHMNLMFPTQNGELIAFSEVPFEWLDSYDFTAKLGDTRSLAQYCTQYFAKFLFKAPSEGELINRQKKILLWMDKHVKWEE